MKVIVKVNHEFQYGLLEIIKPFFPNEEIIFTDDETDSWKIREDVFIKSVTETDKEKTIIRSFITYKEVDETFIITSSNDENSIKTAIKKSLYITFVKLFNKSLPWGILTGIRPVKLVHNFFDDGLTDKEIIDALMRDYYVSEKKARLALDVALNNKRYIKKTRKNKVDIYIGIPFCPSRCYFCSFASNSLPKHKDMIRPYLTALEKEIKATAHYLKEKNITIETIYIGGGTPTSIEDEDFESLLDKVNEYWPIKDEFTCEAGRPDTITEEKLRIMKKSGVNRICINPQTMNDDTLKIIGRNHTAVQVIDSFYLARSFGFTNINMDIILGLPGEGVDHIKNTMERILKLGPENITLHTLSIKRSSRYHEYESITLNNEYIDEMMDYAIAALRSAGMKPYYLYKQKNTVENLENIGFSLENYECVYNILTVEEKQSIIAFGADASTKIVFEKENRIERQYNIKDLELYIERIDEQIEKKLNLLKQLYD